MTRKRPHCPRCELPQRTCLCHWLRPHANRVELVILQHPQEAKEAKNSARLLSLSLNNALRVIGETFEPEALAALLTDNRQNLLLYPGTQDANLPAPPPLPSLLPSAEHLRLVVLDATWRKSLKMLHLNPALQALPRLPLSEPPPSRYRIRKAPRPGQLSTLEASCYALAQLEGDLAGYEPLLEAFDGFVGERLAFLNG